MTISITTFANQSGPIALSQLDTNFINVVAAIDANAITAAAATAALGSTPIQFSPTVSFSGLAVGLTYSAVRYGAYILVNNLVFWTIDVRLSAKGSSSGVLTVGGCPVSPASTFPTGSTPQIALTGTTITFAAGYLAGSGTGNSFTVSNIVSAGSISPIFETACANATGISASGFYVKA